MLKLSFKFTEQAFDTIDIDGEQFDVGKGVEKVQVIGPIDNVTCLECLNYVNRIFDADDPEIQPFFSGGLHPNCRHFVQPIFNAQDQGVAPEDNFDALSEQDRRMVMGQEKYALYKDKQIGWGDLFREDGTIKPVKDIRIDKGIDKKEIK